MCVIYFSFRDESDNSFEGDVMLLMAGVCIIVVYVAVILGKFNEVEHKVREISSYMYMIRFSEIKLGLIKYQALGLTEDNDLHDCTHCTHDNTVPNSAS